MKKVKYINDFRHLDDPKIYAEIQLYQLCEMYLEKDSSVDNHPQVCYELSYIVSGEAAMSTNNIPITVREGDCYLSCPNELHKIISNKYNPVRICSIGFDSDNDEVLQLLRKLNTDFRAPAKRAIHAPEFFDVFLKLFAEIDNNLDFASLKINVLIKELLVETYRHFYDCPPPLNNVKTTDKKILTYQITNYIDNNVRDFNMDKLSAALNYNKQYLAKTFKTIMNQNIQSYYIQRQMTHASQLLTDTDMSITKISEQLNFSSIHTFTRSFTRFFGHNPSQHRNK